MAHTPPGSPRNTQGWRRTLRRLRIATLLAVLAVVLLYALKDVTRRRQRTTWERSLSVALVLLRSGPVDSDAISALRRRVPDLEQRLAEQMRRYRAPSGTRPVVFTVYGPVDIVTPPPVPESSGGVDLARHAWRSWRYFRAVDASADVPTSGFDSRIYLVLRPPANARRKLVEGYSEQGGRIGQVAVELDASMVDFALFVATHELMHTLGANDKYDEHGRARAPEGLAHPNQSPLYPQSAAEVMARNVALSANEERPPETLDELVVGNQTAREIGWLSAR